MKIDKYIMTNMIGFNNHHPYKQAGYSILNRLSSTSAYDYYIKFIMRREKKSMSESVEDDGFYGGSKTIYSSKNKNGYDFSIKMNHHKHDSTVEYFIGRMNKCLISFLTYNKKTKEVDPELVIHSFGYYPDCSDSTNIMKRGEGTSKIMNLFIQFVRDELSKFIKTITLSDNAFFDCIIKKTNKNVKIPMATLYFFKYGRLYYSKYGFELCKKDTKNEDVKRLLKIYNDNDNDNITLEFIEGYVQFIEDMSNMRANMQNDIQLLIDKLSESSSIKEFLQNYHFTDCTIFKIFLEYLCKYLIKLCKRFNNRIECRESIDLNFFTNLTYVLTL